MSNHTTWRRLAAVFLLGLGILLGAPAQAAPTTPTSDFTDNGDGTVTHKITGLTWKRCAEGMTWTGATCTGTASTHTWDQARALTSRFAGKSDWRLPTIAELVTIVERENLTPAINATIFPGTADYSFWSASAFANSSGYVWSVYFRYGGGHGHDGKSFPYHVRLVRGGQLLDSSGFYTPTSDFTDNGDGTVTHKKTTLTWKRCSEGQTWSGSGCTGEASSYTWAQATAMTSSYADKSDWRVPTQNELLTIVEWSNYYPTINSTIFPGTPSAYFWSASTNAGNSRNAWYVDFYGGHSGADGIVGSSYVRLVRGGQSVGTSSTTAGLTGLSLSCPSSVAAGASGSCSASAAYSDGGSKTVSPATWTSSNTTALSVSGGVLTAGSVTTDTPVTLTATYSEGGITKIATTTVTIKASKGTGTGATLTNLTIGGGSSLDSGKTATYTASAIYADGSIGPAGSVTWTSSGAGATIDDKGVLTAESGLATDATVTITALYTESGVTKVAQMKVTVKATTATSACSGGGTNLSAITVVGNSIKKPGDTLEVDYCLKNYNSATRFDVYIAVQLPDGTMLFMQSAGFFGTPTFAPYDGKSAPKAYLTNTLIPDKSGAVLQLSPLPMELPTGTYTFYAIPVYAGKDVFNGFNWVGSLATGKLNFMR